VDVVPELRDPPEQRVQVNLGAAGVRILAVVPVDE
jgi:hypothetical protein